MASEFCSNGLLLDNVIKMTTIAAMKYVVYAKRFSVSPWVRIDSYSDRAIADLVADKYQRDYPQSIVKVEHENTRRSQEN
jgi:hypothetical protein